MLNLGNVFLSFGKELVSYEDNIASVVSGTDGLITRDGELYTVLSFIQFTVLELSEFIRKSVM